MAKEVIQKDFSRSFPITERVLLYSIVDNGQITW
jgi:hypothetical protein